MGVRDRNGELDGALSELDAHDQERVARIMQALREGQIALSIDEVASMSREEITLLADRLLN